MAEDVKINLPSTYPDSKLLTHTTFQNGVVTLVNESNLPPTALAKAKNIFLYEKGAPGPRWGVNWFGSAMPNNKAIDGGAMYQSASGANHMVATAGGNIYRSLDNGVTWDLCNGATLTPGKKCYYTQAAVSGSGNNYMYITNGYDYPVRYDGTPTLVPFTAIPPPSGLSAAQTGLAGAVYGHYYRVAAVNAVGTTQGTTTATVTTNLARGAWDPTHTGTKYVTLSWTAAAGAVRYDIYYADNASDDAANNLYYLDSVGAVATPSYIDAGQQVVNPNSGVPIQNTTGAPRVRELVAVGSRLYGVQDRDFPYRVWFTGSGPYIGYFSDSYDGGYIDLQRGSQFYPIQVADYRDGKGTPLATVWCDSADTRGCVWQVALNSTTLLNTQFTEPSANKLPGSRGTPAPMSVVNVLNDYSFFNYQALYSLGSRAQFLNLLSTDESSADIRPTLTNNITLSATGGICAYYYQAKQFISAPFNSTVNNQTIVYDTERKAYLPEAYTFGMERLFQYTDTSRRNHLLFWKPGDTQFSETSSAIQGDYGVGFNTQLLTGLMPVVKNRFGFMYVDQAEIEVSEQSGDMQIDVLGVGRNPINPFGVQASRTLPNTVSNNFGWSTFPWSNTLFSDFTEVPANTATSSTPKFFVVQKEMTRYQWRIITNDVQSKYLLRALQLSGTETNAGDPPGWRLSS